MAKTEEIFGLLKLPDSALLKNAEVEMGKLQAEIDYQISEVERVIKEKKQLKNQLNSMTLNPEEKLAIKLDHRVDALVKANFNLKGEVARLTRTNNDLIVRLNQKL